eukprot:2880855-Pleurochrysis_carterae.AAC.1
MLGGVAALFVAAAASRPPAKAPGRASMGLPAVSQPARASAKSPAAPPVCGGSFNKNAGSSESKRWHGPNAKKFLPKRPKPPPSLCSNCDEDSASSAS